MATWTRFVIYILQVGHIVLSDTIAERHSWSRENYSNASTSENPSYSRSPVWDKRR